MGMEFSRSVFRRLKWSVIISAGRRNITAKFYFRTSSGNCCDDMKLTLMNGMYGIDSTLSELRKRVGRRPESQRDSIIQPGVDTKWLPRDEIVKISNSERVEDGYNSFRVGEFAGL